MLRLIRARALAVGAPLMSGACYAAWLAADASRLPRCSGLGLAYGYVPFFVVPVVVVAAKCRGEGLSWARAIGLVLATTAATVAILALVWLIWFGREKCGE